jgi:mannitol-1-phosphate/altronate dehydrogenase
VATGILTNLQSLRVHDGHVGANAMECDGIETSGSELAATVARIAREKSMELKVAVPVAMVIHGCREVPGSVFEKSRRR